MPRYRLMCKLTFTDEIELVSEPTKKDIIKALKDVNEGFKNRVDAITIHADTIKVELIEEGNDD